MDKATFERLKKLEQKKERLNRFYSEFKAYPHLVLSNTGWGQKAFWEQKEASKRAVGAGIPKIMDLPDDLNLLNIVLKEIEAEAKRIDKEFSDLLNK